MYKCHLEKSERPPCSTVLVLSVSRIEGTIIPSSMREFPCHGYNKAVREFPKVLLWWFKVQRWSEMSRCGQVDVTQRDWTSVLIALTCNAFILWTSWQLEKIKGGGGSEQSSIHVCNNAIDQTINQWIYMYTINLVLHNLMLFVVHLKF